MTRSAHTIDGHLSITTALCSVPEVEAVLLYGSVARGDVEPHSDVDILILCRGNQKSKTLEALSATLYQQPEKYSLTIYTRRELEFMTHVHSLFMLHIQREAVILLDNSHGFMDGLLQSVQPKASYEEDFRKATALLIPLDTIVSGAPNQLHRLAHAYALFRICGVYLLARHGIFEFSKEQMAQRLANIYPEQALQIKALSDLRSLNNRFYAPSGNRGKIPLEARHCLEFYIASLGRLAGRESRARECGYPEAVGEFANATANGPRRLNYRLRTWFLLLVYDGLNLLCAQRGLPPLDGLNEEQLVSLNHAEPITSVKEATDTVLRYLKSYPLKYFLQEEAKIDTQLARRVLQDLSASAH